METFLSPDPRQVTARDPPWASQPLGKAATMLVSRPAPMAVAVGAPRPRFGAHMCCRRWRVTARRLVSTRAGVMCGPRTPGRVSCAGRGGRACHVGPAFTWCRCLERPEARAFVPWTTPRQARAGRPCGFQPCHLAGATRKGPGCRPRGVGLWCRFKLKWASSCDVRFYF